MTTKLRIMIRAVKIRMERGEQLEDILKSYPRLTDKEKQTIRENVRGDENAQT